MLTAAARTHVGRVRTENEDALVCRPVEGLFAVVDGMGGEAAGEVAAAIAAEAVAAVPNARKQAGEALLAAALRSARGRILAEAARNPAHAQMGAVATAARLEDDGRHLVLAHVGDTRAYRVDRHGITQLTHDHVAATAPAGKKAPVARDLGRADLPEPWVDTARVPVAPGDLVVLCTDGLYDPVGQDELAGALRAAWEARTPVDEVASALVGRALARGGPDNVTVVVVRIGRWRRRGSARRLGAPAAVALLVLVSALAMGAGLWRSRHAPPIPDLVSRSRTVDHPSLVVLPAGARTQVAAGQQLSMRGVRVSAEGWTIVLDPGAILDLSLAAVVAEGPLVVELGAGAHLTLRDARISAQSLTVSGGGSFACDHSLIQTAEGGWAPAEGVVRDLAGCRVGVRGQPDSTLLDAPAAAPSPPPDPAADPAPPAATPAATPPAPTPPAPSTP